MNSDSYSTVELSTATILEDRLSAIEAEIRRAGPSFYLQAETYFSPTYIDLIFEYGGKLGNQLALEPGEVDKWLYD